MQNRLLKFVREQNLIAPGDTVICAVSGGADSVAMLFALYLLREKLGITLEAAHFNHNLRGEESLRDETFVRELCARYAPERRGWRPLPGMPGTLFWKAFPEKSPPPTPLTTTPRPSSCTWCGAPD